MEKDFLDMLPHTITTYALVSRTSAGYPVEAHSSTPSTWAARITEKFKLVRDRTGTETVSRANAVINCTGALTLEHRFVLPDGSIPPLIALHKIADQKGTHHYVAYW
ncbi:MAG: hypothetical protein WC359_15030 [Dehalococcoidia bacterium]|jgi:hypothetical protein